MKDWNQADRLMWVYTVNITERKEMAPHSHNRTFEQPPPTPRKHLLLVPGLWSQGPLPSGAGSTDIFMVKGMMGNELGNKKWNSSKLEYDISCVFSHSILGQICMVISYWDVERYALLVRRMKKEEEEEEETGASSSFFPSQSNKGNLYLQTRKIFLTILLQV